MAISLHFLGAARNVTGSRYVLASGKNRILIDCGLYQERDYLARNWSPFPLPPATLTCAVLTHCHLDHCGWLPRLAADGFNGRVFCTPATAELAALIMEDSGRIQEEDAKYKAKRHAREGRVGQHGAPRPLYTAEDARQAGKRLTPLPLAEIASAAADMKISMGEAGHVLGSATALVAAANDGRICRVLFSGDLGRWSRPILPDPAPAPAADYVVIESTYGDRRHEESGDVAERLATIIRAAAERGGKILIPAFAVERSQEILFHFNRLREDGRAPALPVFLDSPLASRVTAVFRRHAESMDKETRAMLSEGRSPFAFPGLHLCDTQEDSKRLNAYKGPAIIIAGSGMCTGGRIKHHLRHQLGKPENIILFVGYQASGTLGRQLVEGSRTVRLFGEEHVVRARVEQIQAFSGHADQDDLIRWLRTLPAPPRQVFVTHGGPNVAPSFAALISAKTGWPAHAPCYGEIAEL